MKGRRQARSGCSPLFPRSSPLTVLLDMLAKYASASNSTFCNFHIFLVSVAVPFFTPFGYSPFDSQQGIRRSDYRNAEVPLDDKYRCDAGNSVAQSQLGEVRHSSGR